MLADTQMTLTVHDNVMQKGSRPDNTHVNEDPGLCLEQKAICVNEMPEGIGQPEAIHYVTEDNVSVLESGTDQQQVQSLTDPPGWPDWPGRTSHASLSFGANMRSSLVCNKLDIRKGAGDQTIQRRQTTRHAKAT
ncbi:hypothetical protein PoB_002488000 [Plakobranchus ocellatus]|uniref:Uncharacterized protein n=1 Tax=Plakobranchus ocellatus TaxID=259542 RepID=A0AAV3ZRJ4_9GAST|nr:hypothetical protein PoB_002488000 [Plakobranchus ocellatus]